jgi:hypothetical protein
MTWYVDRHAKVETEPFHVAFKSRLDAQKLALHITAIRNAAVLRLNKAPSQSARDRLLRDAEIRVLLAMEVADMAKDAPAAEAYADSLGKDVK